MDPSHPDRNEQFNTLALGRTSLAGELPGGARARTNSAGARTARPLPKPPTFTSQCLLFGQLHKLCAMARRVQLGSPNATGNIVRHSMSAMSACLEQQRRYS